MNCGNKKPDTFEIQSIKDPSNEAEITQYENDKNTNDIRNIETNNDFVLNESYWAFGEDGIGLYFDIENNKYKLTDWGPEWTPIAEGVFEINNGKIYLTPTFINDEYGFEWIRNDLLNKMDLFDNPVGYLTVLAVSRPTGCETCVF